MDTRPRTFDMRARPDVETTATAQAPAAERTGHARPSAVCGAGGGPDPQAHAVALAQASGGRLGRAGPALLRLQQARGNRHVQQVARHARRAADPGPAVQASLAAGPAGDRHEQEADRVAHQVAARVAPVPAAGGAAPGRGWRAPVRQRAGGGRGGAVDPHTEQAIRRASGSGRRLPGRLRAPMEQALGADFGGVRLHTDIQADQLSRALGARAFTTGQEIFFRRGGYRPDGLAGLELLAHELTHVVQQTADLGAARPAGAADVSPAAGAGIIQRAKIGELDTEDRHDLRALKRRVEKMETLREIDEMLRQIPVASRTPSEADLALDLEIQRVSVRAKSRQRPAVRDSRPETTDARRTGPRTEDVPAAPALSVPAPDPARRPAAASEQVQEASPPRLVPREPSPPPVTREPVTRERITREPVTREPVTAPGSPGTGAPDASLEQKAASLMERAVTLGSGPGNGPDAVAAWIAAVGGFLREQDAWDTAFLVTRPIQLRSLRRDLQERAGRLEAERKGHERAIRESAAQQVRQEQESAQLERAIARREQELTAGKKTAGQYVDLAHLNTRLDDSFPKPAQEEWGPRAQEIPVLFLEWLFVTAAERAEKHESTWVAQLLDFLKKLRKSQAEAEVSGPHVDMIGRKANSGKEAGQAQKNWIVLRIDLPGTNLPRLLTGEDDESRKARESLVEETTSTFIHEAAHIQQMRTYGNASYPWKPAVELGGFGAGQGGSKGIPLRKWPNDVKEAYLEFKDGGVGGRAQSDPKWQNIVKGLHAPEYYDPNTGTDERASELVSHLMELVYAWRDDAKFRETFPDCDFLLDKVLKRQR